MPEDDINFRFTVNGEPYSRDALMKIFDDVRKTSRITITVVVDDLPCIPLTESYIITKEAETFVRRRVLRVLFPPWHIRLARWLKSFGDS